MPASEVYHCSVMGEPKIMPSLLFPGKTHVILDMFRACGQSVPNFDHPHKDLNWPPLVLLKTHP